jgi:TonB family protein
LNEKSAAQRENEEKKLKPVYRPQPEYTEDARAAKIEGSVKLAVSIDAQGEVKDVQVTKPLYPSLDRSATDTIRTWRFAPYLQNGEPVARKITTEVVFSLDSWMQERKQARERE